MRAMNRKHPSQRAARAGFTLLELLLVVGILVMLAAIALPNLMGTQKQTQRDAATAQIGAFEDALRIYQAQNGDFPKTEQGLKALVEKPQEEPIPKKWAGPYLTETNVQDPWGHEYHYAFPGEHNEKRKPDIWSAGPDGEENTEDDIVNWTDADKEKDSGDRKS